MEQESAPTFVELEPSAQCLSEDYLALPSDQIVDLIPSWLGRDLEEGKPRCKTCGSEVAKLREEVKEAKLIQDALESELRWAMEGKLNAELALAESLTQDGPQNSPLYGVIGPTGSFPTRRGFSNGLPSNRNLVQQQSRVEIVQREKIMDLETCLQRLSAQFQGLADNYNSTIARLQQAQDENYQHRKDNLELHNNNVELTKGHLMKDRRIHKMIERQNLTVDQHVSALPSAPFPGAPALEAHLSHRDVKAAGGVAMSERPVNDYHGVHDRPTLMEISELNIKPRLDHESMPVEVQGSILSTVMKPSQKAAHQILCTADTPPVLERTRNFRPTSEVHVNREDSRHVHSRGKESDIDHSSVLQNRNGSGMRGETRVRERESERRSMNRENGFTSPREVDSKKKSLSGRLGPISPPAPNRSPPDGGHVRIKPGGKPSVTNQIRVDVDGRNSRRVLDDLDAVADAYLTKPIRNEGGSSAHLKSQGTRTFGPGHEVASPTNTPPRKRAISPDEVLGGASPGSVARGALTPVSRSSRKRTPPSELNINDQNAEPMFGYEGSDPLIDAAQLDVFNQGTFKTELCNKWEEIGTCPYGTRCQYAHGVGELRPIIRHPRYKTELCRMVATGKECPYGHRCHFRHAMTTEERDKIMWC